MKTKNILLSLLVVVIAVLTGMNFYLVAHRNKVAENQRVELARQKARAQAEAKATKKIVEVNLNNGSEGKEVNDSVVASVDSGNSTDKDLAILDHFRGVYPEDPSTYSGNDPTESEFYVDGNHNWNWQLTSNHRGVIEHGQVLSGKTTGDGVDLEMRSISNNSRYTLHLLLGSSNGGYHLYTSFQTIDGAYNKP